MSQKTNELLRSARLELGWTQSTAAKRADIPQNTISQYETGLRIPTAEALSKLCEAYGIPPEDMAQCALYDSDKRLTPAEKDWIRAFRNKDLAMVKEMIATYFLSSQPPR